MNSRNVRICAVCDGSNWQPFIITDSNRIMTGDQRIIEGNLCKVICKSCGTVANASSFSECELKMLYGYEYQLNTFGHEEHLFFTKNSPVPRSQVVADWILPHLPRKFDSLIEIGCGEGLLLEKILTQFPGKKISGFDGSQKACELARSRGLPVKRRLMFGGQEKIPHADIILLVNVVEHIEDIAGFLSTVRKAITKQGRVIFCLPIQNYAGYDIFFAEHVWHFTVNQFCHLLRKNKFEITHCEYSHPVNHGIGLFVCKRIEKQNDYKVLNESRRALKNRDYWKRIFKKVDSILLDNDIKRLAVFGGGEVLTLLLTFTSLGDKKISACLDEDKAKIGTQKHGINVQDTNWLKNNKVDGIIMTTNPKYYPEIIKKLSPYGVKVFSILQ